MYLVRACDHLAEYCGRFEDDLMHLELPAFADDGEVGVSSGGQDAATISMV